MASTRDTDQLSNEARAELEQTRRDAERLAGDAADTARSAARREIDEAKSGVADRAERVAEAVDSTADDLDSGDGDERISGYGHSMATLMRRMAGGLREHDIDEFAAELADYARRSPGVFLAGSVALGFGLSRFLKASSERSRGSEEGYELDFDDDFDAEGTDDADEEYDFDTALQPAPPDASRTRGSEPWPADTGEEPSPDEVSPPTPSTSTDPTGTETDPSRGGNDHG